MLFENLMLVAIILFVITYALLLILPKYRAYIAVLSALLFLVFGIMPINQVFHAINWNVIFMIAGTMGVVGFFIDSKMPNLIADVLIKKTPNVKWAIIVLALFSSIISAFIDNVATVLMIAPVALSISKKLKISPIPSIIAIAISSNLQGAATLVGDTTSILLGGEAKMDFLDFFFYKGKIGIFFVVQAGAVIATLILLLVFRKYNQPITAEGKTKVTDYFPTFLLSSIVILLIFASFLPNKPEITNGLICLGLFLIGLFRELIRSKDFETFKKSIKEIDFTTIVLLMGIFVIISALTAVGLIEAIGDFFVTISDNNIFLIYTIIVWFSVLISGFVDNIPYVATMLSVVTIISNRLEIDPTLLYFGLLIGATLGGNLTPIGASANITGIGILRKEGYNVTTGQFMKIGIPFTLAAVLTGYALIWFIWY